MNAFEISADIINSINYTNPWKGTPFEDFYTFPPKTKGNAGEEIAKAIFKNNGDKVENRTDSGHDCIVNGIKTEVKFSLATDRNKNGEFTFNHIGFNKSWEQIVFIGVDCDCEFKIATYSKQNFPMHLLSHQQGGKKSNNDDFMIVGKNSHLLFQ